jgi:hypothetical protein
MGEQEEHMQLNDTLQICLLALASRYPQHVVDINEDLLGPQLLGADGWSSLDVIEMLEHTAPDLLQAMAKLVVDTQKSEIYLIEHGEEIPAILVHCRGKVPIYKGNEAVRRRTQELQNERGLVMGHRADEPQTTIQ